MNLIEVESELKKRLSYPYKWGQKQNDYFDSLTNFIYKIDSFEKLLHETNIRFKEKPDYKKYFDYSLNRWFNFWSAQAVEKIFCSLPNVQPALDGKDKLVDFTIDGVKFDHKTSIFPKNFPYPINEAVKKTDELIKWLFAISHSSKENISRTGYSLFFIHQMESTGN